MTEQLHIVSIHTGVYKHRWWHDRPFTLSFSGTFSM